MPKFNLDALLRNFQTEVKEKLPTVLANQAKNFFAQSFAKQGWDNNGVHPWKEVKRRIPGEKAYKYPKSKDLGRRTRAILVKSGVLRRAVQDCIRETNFNRIRLMVDVPYAKYHNEGSPESHLPRRRFMGDSQTLQRLQREEIVKALRRVFENSSK